MHACLPIDPNPNPKPPASNVSHMKAELLYMLHVTYMYACIYQITRMLTNSSSFVVTRT